MSVYKVIGRRGYREHQPGEIFEAVLTPASEARAMRNGAITRIKRSVPTIQPGSYTLPRGWPTNQQEE